MSAPPDGPVDAEARRRAPMALVTGAFVLLVLVIVVVLLVVKVTRGTTVVVPPPVTPAPVAVVQEAATVPTTTWSTVGAPDPQGPPPTVLVGQRPLVLGGKTAVVYVGSEFSPYCAAVRWALVVALSRFGTFDHLGATSSAGAEVFGGIPTFSFEGTSYRSRYVSLSAVEEYGPTLDSTAPAGFPLLQRPSAWTQSLMRRYGVSAGSDSVVPFIDIGNRVVMVGAGIGFSPAVFEGLSMAQIGSDLSVPTSAVSQAVVGAANEITAAVCAGTDGRPGSICRSSGTLAGATRLGL